MAALTQTTAGRMAEHKAPASERLPLPATATLPSPPLTGMAAH